MVERIEAKIVATALERTELEKDLALVTNSVVPNPEATPLTTPMSIPASATTFQEIPATPTTVKTLLLLTFGPKFDKTTTQPGSESAKSSAGNTKKLPFG